MYPPLVGLVPIREKVLCVNCRKPFDVTVPDKIIRGPFPT